MAEQKTYKPRSLYEARAFEARFCEDCNANFGDRCPIKSDGLTLEPEEPAFPKEWIVGSDGPECTAYQSINDGEGYGDEDEEDEEE